MRKYLLRTLCIAFVLSLCLPMVACDMELGGLVGELLADNKLNDEVVPEEWVSDIFVDDLLPEIEDITSDYDFTESASTDPETNIPSQVYSDGLLFESNGDGTCVVVGLGTCTDAELVIPLTSLDGDSVTGIGAGAFSECNNLTSVTIPDGVTNIGNAAFMNCMGLTSVILPDSVTTIGDTAFFCTKLMSITIPDSVTRIGIDAFSYCVNLTNISIPDSVTSIGNQAFSGCSGLTSITVEEGNPVYHSVDNCLIKTESATIIAGCRTSKIPDSVTGIGEGAFSGCSDLTSVVIPDSVTSIGGYAFAWCSSLTSIDIPNGVTSIGYHAFTNCTALTSITIPDNVTKIENNAFEGCVGLTNVFLGNRVEIIDSVAFYGCTGLTDIYYAGTEGEWMAITIGDLNDPLASATIHYNYVSEE